MTINESKLEKSVALFKSILVTVITESATNLRRRPTSLSPLPGTSCTQHQFFLESKRKSVAF